MGPERQPVLTSTLGHAWSSLRAPAIKSDRLDAFYIGMHISKPYTNKQFPAKAAVDHATKRLHCLSFIQS